MMAEYTQLEKIRLQKIEELRAEGIEPYPTRAERTHTSQQAIAALDAVTLDGQATAEVPTTVVGRIRATRPMGKLTFAHIEDGAGKIQLFLRVNELGQEKVDFFNRMFDLGDFIQASGLMMRTRTGEATLQVHQFQMLAKSVSPLPADKDETLEDGSLVRHAALDALVARRGVAGVVPAREKDVREAVHSRPQRLRLLKVGVDPLHSAPVGKERDAAAPPRDRHLDPCGLEGVH